jgi:multidrug resistance efflux pump
MRRADALVADGSISARERDSTRATLLAAEAAVRQASAGRAIGTQDVRTVVVGRGGLEAAVQGAEAQLRLAQIDLDNTIIRAPIDGELSEVGVRLGAYVTAGTQLVFLVPHEVWIVANFKEAQTHRMRIGQSATFRVDALGGTKLRGHVQTMSPAAGSEFAVLKPDNATGNFVKVAQRIAVRIAVDAGQAARAQSATGHVGRGEGAYPRRRQLMRRLALLLPLLLAGCMGDGIRPVSVPPVSPPPAWRTDAAATGGALDRAWWQSFGDPALTALVGQGTGQQ